MKHITIGQILTDAEIVRVTTLWQQDKDNFHRRVREEIVKPNMERINNSLGQENDPDYITYAIEYVMLRTIR